MSFVVKVLVQAVKSVVKAIAPAIQAVKTVIAPVAAAIVKAITRKSVSIPAVTRATGGAGPVQQGQAGLKAAGVTQNTQRITLSDDPYLYGVPDELAGNTLTEVKNVLKQSATRQIRDYAQYAENTEREFVLKLRGEGWSQTATKISGPLKQMEEDGKVLIEWFEPLE